MSSQSKPSEDWEVKAGKDHKTLKFWVSECIFQTNVLPACSLNWEIKDFNLLILQPLIFMETTGYVQMIALPTLDGRTWLCNQINNTTFSR